MINPKIEQLEQKLKEIELQNAKDEKTENFKFKDRKFKSLSKRAMKKPEYVLVQYLRNNRTVDFFLSKVISGNMIVVNNKGHELNPQHTWIRGKVVWYIVREKDTIPVSVDDKIKGHSTDDHTLLMKMVLGAVQKKELAKDTKKIAIIIVVIAVVAVLGWIMFGG